jgi:signal peptidase I
VSAAVYATLIVTFGVQVARVEGLSMVPTLEDQDRLIVNKLLYRLGDPRVGDIVMLTTRRIRQGVRETRGRGTGRRIRSENGRVFRNGVPIPDDFISGRVPVARHLGARTSRAGTTS